MSKGSKVILIFDIIFTILMAVLVIVNVWKGCFTAAILWNMDFTLGVCNVTLDLAQGQIEKITAKLKEEDNKK